MVSRTLLVLSLVLGAFSVLQAQPSSTPARRPALRVLVCGRAQTPSIDAVLELFPREMVLRRLQDV